MSNKLQRILSIVLVFVLFLTSMPANAFATGIADGIDVVYTDSDNGAPVDDTPDELVPAAEGQTTEKTVATLNGNEYTSLAKAFEDAVISGGMIELTQDVKETVRLSVSGTAVEEVKSVTLNLNGHTWDCGNGSRLNAIELKIVGKGAIGTSYDARQTDGSSIDVLFFGGHKKLPSTLYIDGDIVFNAELRVNDMAPSDEEIDLLLKTKSADKVNVTKVIIMGGDFKAAVHVQDYAYLTIEGGRVPKVVAEENAIVVDKTKNVTTVTTGKIDAVGNAILTKSGITTTITALSGDEVTFKVSAPAGLDPDNVRILKPFNGEVMLSKVDGYKDRAAEFIYKFGDNTVDYYKIDWTNDGTFDVLVEVKRNLETKASITFNGFGNATTIKYPGYSGDPATESLQGLVDWYFLCNDANENSMKDWGMSVCDDTPVLTVHADLGHEIAVLGNNDSQGKYPTPSKTMTWTIKAEGKGVKVDPDNFHMAGGYNLTQNDDGTWTAATEKIDAVAMIGTQGYETLQAAIDAVQNGDTIVLLQDVTENVTLTEKVGLYYTIDGNGKTMNGSMTVASLSDTNDNRRIIIKNINFVDTNDANVDFISSVNTNHYPRLTVEGCTFTGSGNDGDVAIRLKSSHSVVIKDCTGTGLHSFLQNTSGWNLTIENVTVSESKGGLALGTVQGVTVKGCEIDVDGYGIRLDADTYNNNAVIEDCKVEAFIPVVVRKVNAKSNLTFKGTNTMTQTNEDGYWCVIGATEYEENGELPVAPSDKVHVIFEDTDLDQSGMFMSQFGTWGGIDWMLNLHTGTLTIAPTKGTPVPDAVCGKTYEVGEWREAVRYNSKGEGVAIEGWPYDRSKVKTLVIKEGVTSIGSFAAQGFTNLTGEVVIPSTVTYIGQEAFQKSTFTKLTFAAGGTEELCIAQGAFKNLIIEEVSLPSDRPVHLHAWVFNNCLNLKSADLPASLVSVHGTNHIDYFKDFNAHSNPTWTKSSEIFAYDANLETITFGSAEVRDMFFANNNATAKDYIVAFAGLTAYTSLQSVFNNAKNGEGEAVTLVKNINLKDTVTVPAGKTVTLDLNGKTISQSKDCTASYAMIENKGDLTITGNGKISFKDTGAGDSSFGWGSYTIRNEGKLIVENGTIEHLGEQAFATHCIQAIFNYSGSTTINGGTISTPNYRSIRLWSGNLTINGGIFDGQVWVHCVNDSAKLTINGGSFGPNGNDGSSVFVNNSDHKAELSVTGGTFETKIGANSPENITGDRITGGTFTEAAMNGTNVALLGKGCEFAEVADNDGHFAIIKPVAKVGNTKYESIDEAIAEWTNGATLTLLADVTLSDVITLSSTENHTLNLGSFTMTAASGKNAIEITCNGRGSASYALTVNADAENPGGITATGKACIYYKKSGSTKDRPIIVINNGVFNGSYSINSISNGNTNCPQFRIYGGTFNGNVNLTKNLLQVYGGTFNGWINCTGDQNAYREIHGGTFKNWQFMTADNDLKFAVGTVARAQSDGSVKPAVYNVGLYVDDNGYLVVGGPVITEPGEKFVASSTNYGGWSSYLKYSSAATNGLYYTSAKEAFADNNKTTGAVTVYVDELDMTGISYKGKILIEDELTVTFAEGTKPDWTVVSEGKEVVYTDSTENGVVTRIYKAFVAMAEYDGVKYASVADALEAAKAAGVAEVTITLIGETTKESAEALDDSFYLYSQRVFDSVTIKQKDTSKPYYIAGFYTGSRTNGGSFKFDGVNIIVLDQYIFEGKVTLSNNSVIKSVADANCFIYNGETTIEPGSKLYGVIEDFRGGDLIVDGGKTDGTYNAEPDFQDAILIVNWSGDKLILKNGAYVKINSANEVGRLTVNNGAAVELTASKLDACEYITLNAGSNLLIDGKSQINTPKITGAGKIVIDAIGMTAGEFKAINADLSGFTGTIEVINNPALYAVVEIDKIVLKPCVAKIGDVFYKTLSDALTAAVDGDVVELLWTEGNAPIAMNGAVFGKSVTITGTATVDWSKGWLFVGRGGEGNGTVIFDNAKLTSASNNATYGIHVSGREKGAADKYDGTLVIKNSAIELDFLINKGVMTLDNSTLTVKNGFAVGGRPASETESGADATATITLNNGSELIVNNHNGMGLGYEAIGVMNVNAGSTFECTQDFLVTAKGTMNVNGGTVKVDGKLTNSNVINVNAGENTLNIATLEGNSIDLNEGAIVANSTVGGAAYVAGNVTFRGDNTFTMITDYGDYYSSETPSKWTVEKGASLTLTKNDRYGLGYGDQVTVYGELENALTARDSLTDADASLNLYGGLVGMTNSAAPNANNELTVKDAYVIFGVKGDKSFGNKPGNYYGNYKFNFENSVITANGFKFYEDKGASVLNVTDSDLLVNGVFMTNDTNSEFNFTNSVILSKATSNGSDDKNQNAGVLNLVNTKLTYNAAFTNIGTVKLDKDSLLTAPSITGNGTLIIDATGMTAGELKTIKADVSGFTGTIEVINNPALYAVVENGKIVLKAQLVGEGTETNPYQISNAEELILFRDSVNAGETKYNAPGVYVALTADIDMKSATWERGIGDGINATFDGIFDGGNNTISNLNLAPKADGDGYICGGLFGYTYGAAVIKNLTLDNINVTTTDEGHNVGALVGFAYNKGGKLTVSNVTVSNSKITAPNAYGVGAIVGYSYYGMNPITGCSVVKVEISGYSFVGGIAGYSESNITGCSVKNANITATSKGAGGIAGLVLGKNEITGNTVADTTVSASKNWGYVVGEIATEGVLVAENKASEPQVGGVYSTGKPVEAKIGDKYYTTFAEAYKAAKAGDTIDLVANLTAEEVILIDKSITINGNDHYVTSSATRVFRVTTSDVEVTMNAVNVVSTAKVVYPNDVRGIAVDPALSNVKLTLNNCSVDFTDASANDWAYAVNVAGNGSGHTVTINGGSYEGANVINIYGANNTIIVKDATLNCTYPNNDLYSGACIWVLQNQNSSVEATGNTFNGTNAVAFNLGTGTALTESNNTDNTKIVVAKVGTEYFNSLADAFAAAQDGDTVKVLQNAKLAATVKNTKKVTLDLNGKTITGTDNNTSGNFYLIDNRGNLTITGNGVITLTAKNDRDWNASSVVIANNPGGKLVVENGTIKHLGGTDMAYAIDNLTNGKGTYAETVINGGTIKSTYRAVRQFLNGIEAQNILTINGGTIEGTNKAIWMQDPSKNANTGTLTVGANAVVNGDVFLTVTAGSTEWPVNVSIAKAAMNGKVLTNENVPAGYELVETETGYTVKNGVAKIGNEFYATLQEAFKAVKSGDTVTLLQNVTIDEYWDARYTGSKFTVPVTINGNGHTIKFTNTVYDGGNYMAAFRFEAAATVQNLTIDMSEAKSGFATRIRAISAKADLTVDNCTFIGNGADNNTRAIIFGEGAGANVGNVTVSVTNSTFTNWKRGLSDNENGQNVKAVTATGNTLTNAGVNFGAAETVVFTDNTISGAEVIITSYNDLIDDVTILRNNLDNATGIVKNAADITNVQDEFTAIFEVSTKAELNAALTKAKEGTIIKMIADIDYGTDQLAITKAITLDLGGKTLTTRNAFGGMSVKGNPTIKNGTIVHASNTAAIKVWNAAAFEDLVIDVQGKGDANKTIGGIVLQSGSTTQVGSIKNVTIKGAALTNGIETYNCGDATENVIGSMENVMIDALGTGMLISAPCGTATNCSIKGGTNGIEIWIKGNYSASLDLVNSKVEGGVYAHDEFSSNPDIVNNGTLSLTVDAATTGASDNDMTLTLARAENVGGVVKEFKDKAVAKVNDTYYLTLDAAMAAAKAGDTVTIFEGTYAVPNMKAGITVVGEGNVLLEGTLSGTLENLTLKNLHIKGGNAQRWAYAKGDLVFENVTFEATSVYALHFDGIAAGTNLLYKNCTIIGWAALGGSPASCVFDGCTIKGNGSYGVIRTYFDATINNCTFDVANVNTNDVYEDGIHAVDGAIVTVTNSTNVNGDMKNLANVHANSEVWIDGVVIRNIAKTNDNYYLTLQAAIDACVAGDNTVTLLHDSDEDVTIKQAEGVNITIDGAKNTYSGTMTIHGGSRYDGAEKLTIQNMKFETSEAGHYFIDSNSTASAERYAHNVTVVGCYFTATGAGVNSAAAMRIRQGFNIEIIKTEADNLHSVFQGYGVAGVKFTGVTAQKMKNGIAVGTSTGVHIEDCRIEATGYGVRADGNGAYDMTVKSSNITAELPIVVRKATGAYNLTVDGGSLTGTNNKGYQVILTKGDDGSYEIPELNYKLTVSEGIKVFPTLEGEGTAENPFLIRNVEELIFFRNSVNKGETKYNAPGVYVALADDIDMKSATWERGIGDGINATFDGIFDGKMHTIKNLNMAPKPDSDGYLCGGLFGYTYGAAVIKNLVLENITVTASGAGHNVGALVGFANNNGGKLNVSNVTVKNVTIDAPGAYGVGAIVGYSYRAMGTISNCTVDGATITGYSFVGGITGYSYSNAVISGCSVNKASINATSRYAGGIAGIVLSGNQVIGNTVAGTSVSASETNSAFVVGAIAAEGILVADNTAAEPQVGVSYETGNPVEAKIGNKYYTTIDSAYAAAKAGETITLLADLSLSEVLVLENGIKLDLNGNALTGAVYGIIVMNGGTYTVMAGYMLAAPNGDAAFCHTSDAVFALGESEFTIVSGTVTMVKDGATENFTTLTVNEGATLIVAEGVTCKLAGQAVVNGNLTVNGSILLTKIDATLKAQTGLNVTTEIADHKVVYENGEYKVVAKVYVAEINGTKYESIQEAVNKANDDDTIKVIKAIDITDFTEAQYSKLEGKYNSLVVVANKSVTIDLNDMKISGQYNGSSMLVGLFSTENNGHLTLKNGNLEVTSNEKVYSLIANYEPGCSITIENGTYTLDAAIDSLLYSGCGVNGEQTEGIIVNDGTFTLGNVGTGENGKPWIINVLNQNAGHVLVNGGTFNSDISHQFWANEVKVPETKALKKSDDGLWKIDASVAYAVETATSTGSQSRNVGYATLAEAIAANSNKVVLVKDIQLDTSITIDKDVELDLNGKTIAGIDNATGSFGLINIQSGVALTINDTVGSGKITLTATNNRGWNAYSSVISNQRGTLTVNGGTIEHLGGTDMAYAIDNLTNTGAGDATTVINGGTIKSNYRAIRQFLNSTKALNILTVNGGTIEGANKSIWMQDANASANPGALTVSANAALKGNVLLSVTAGSTEWPVEVSIAVAALQNGSEVAANANVPANYYVVENNGIISVQHGVAKIGNAYYMSLAAAIAAAKAGDTIELLADITEDVTVNKDLTIDGANFKYTGNIAVKGSAVDVIIKNINFVNGSGYAVTTNTVKSVTVENCTVTNYGYGFLYANKATVTVVVKNVTVNDCNYGFHWVYGSNATLENVTMTNVAYGLYIQNYAAKTITVKNSTITSIAIWERSGYSAVQTFKFEGANTVGTLEKSQYAKYVLSEENATVAAETADANVTTSVEGCTVVYANGKYAVAKVVAKINENGYATFADALNAVEDGETITLTGVAGSESGEIEFTKDIEFTITGNAPEYALPVVTFQNATVNIKDAVILIPELDARQNATINVIDSIVHDAGGNSIVKSYFNGAINISGNSVVYTMQVTTMGYINVSGNAKLNATWQTNVYGNGLITVKDDATLATAALQLTGKDYSGRDNTDADRVGKPATIVVNGANLIVGKVYSDNGADYSYNSGKGINVGTVAGKTAVLDIKNGANVEIHMANGETMNVGAGGIVNVDGNLNVACRSEGGTATLTNNGSIVLTDIAAKVVSNECGNVTTNVDDYKVQYADGAYSLIPKVYVAQIGTDGAKFETVAEAIAAAKAGDTINLLADITEDVTVNKDLTIDGANFKYTGNISVKGSAVDVIIKNINFVNGSGYAVTTNTIKSVTVENCTVTNYAFGFLYANKATVTVVVKNVTVNNCNYGFHWVYGSNATLENVIMTNVANGLFIQNYAAKTITVKNSTISSIEIWERSGYSAVQTFKFEGANTVGTLTDSQYAKYVLSATDATLTASAGATVTTTVAGHAVKYVDGTYTVAKAVAQVGDKFYATLQSAIDAAKSGDEIVVLENIDLATTELVILDNSYNTYFLVENKNVTINLNGKTISGNTKNTKMLVGVFSTDNGGHLTLTGNGTVNATSNGNVYALIANYEPGCAITIENGTYKLDKAKDCLLYTGGNEGIIVNDGTFTLGNIGVADVNNGQPWIFNGLGQNTTKVIVNGGTFNADINHQFWANEVKVSETKALKNNGNGTWTVADAVAYTLERATSTGAYGRKVGYATLTEAVQAAHESVDYTVTLLVDSTADFNVNGQIALVLNGMSYTGTVTLTNVDATLTADANLKVTTSLEPINALEGYYVDYVSGVYMVKKYLLGDALEDGELKAGDVLAIMKYVMDNTVAINTKNADFNNDGTVDMHDAYDLMTYLDELHGD